MSLLEPLLHTPRTWLAAAIARVKINQVEFLTSHQQIQKKRSWYALPLRILGNRVFAHRTPSLEVLATKTWLAWERQIQTCLGRGVVETSSNRLECTTIAGEPLSQLLDKHQNLRERLALVKIAAEAIREFHSHSIKHQDGETLLSHGDAACYNLLIDTPCDDANWIDFDLRHNLDAPIATRHSDDLRALVFSAASYFNSDEIQSVVEQLRLYYANPKTWSHFVSLIDKRHYRSDIFHLAQMRRARASMKPAANHQILDEKIADTILSSM